jgi:IPT/TIG domain-containing protein
MSESNETVSKPEVDRRRFLAAGALASGAAAFSAPSVLLAQGSPVISPVITSVSPTSGAEGTVITIVGNGFDPNPANNLVVLGTLAKADVIQATPFQLVARIGPVVAAGSVGLTVVVGTSTSMPGQTIQDGETTAILLPGTDLCGIRQIGPSLSFELTEPSLGMLDLGPIPPKTEFEFTLTEPCLPTDRFTIHVDCAFADPAARCRHLIGDCTIAQFMCPGGVCSPEECAKKVGMGLEICLSDFIVEVAGSKITIRPAAVTPKACSGYVKKDKIGP